MKTLNLKFGILITIIFLATFFRFYKLNQNPPGLYWDEAVLGYDAYSILKTGKDHHGVTLPLFFESFGDWKLPVYHYLLIPSIAIFGLNEFAVRFPSALLGTLTVLLTYFLAKQLLTEDGSLAAIKKRSANLEFKSELSSLSRSGLCQHHTADRNQTINLGWLRHVFDWWQSCRHHLFEIRNLKLEIPTLATLMLAISPWHIQFSRGGFEATAGLFFVTFGVYLFLFLISNRKIKTRSAFFLPVIALATAGLFTLSMYSYHAYRIFTPLLVISLIFINFELFKKNIVKLIFVAIFSIILLLPLLLFTFSPNGRVRATTQSIFSQNEYETTRVYYDMRSKKPLRFLSKYWSFSLYNAYLSLNNYMDHFSPVFLFYRGDQIGRHSQVDMGQIYLFEGILVIAAIFAFKKLNKRSLNVMLIWLLLAPIPAMIVKPTPHAARTLQMVLPLSFFLALGAYFLFSSKKLLIGKFFLIIVIFYSFLTYLHLLFIHYPKKFSADWQDGNRQMVLQVKKYQDNFDKVYITNINQAPYIYLLFYLKFDPRKFIESKGNSDSFGKYYFVPRDINPHSDGRILYVAPTWEKIEGNLLATVNDSAGRHIYSLWEVNGVN